MTKLLSQEQFLHWTWCIFSLPSIFRMYLTCTFPMLPCSALADWLVCSVGQNIVQHKLLKTK